MNGESDFSAPVAYVSRGGGKQRLRSKQSEPTLRAVILFTLLEFS